MAEFEKETRALDAKTLGRCVLLLHLPLQLQLLKSRSNHLELKEIEWPKLNRRRPWSDVLVTQRIVPRDPPQPLEELSLELGNLRHHIQLGQRCQESFHPYGLVFLENLNISWSSVEDESKTDTTHKLRDLLGRERHSPHEVPLLQGPMLRGGAADPMGRFFGGLVLRNAIHLIEESGPDLVSLIRAARKEAEILEQRTNVARKQPSAPLGAAST
mmetsp:Transcript_19468/g.42575  ORF Transcript_19468/g.42575 Transcript_19468/m.42575 type:complete len:215 (-) Transcript_19468:988-1632(-)